MNIDIRRRSSFAFWRSVKDGVKHIGVDVEAAGYRLLGPLWSSTTEKEQSWAIQQRVDKYAEQIGLKGCLVSAGAIARPDLATLSPRRANIGTSGLIADMDKLDSDKTCIEVEHGNCEDNT